MAAHRDLWLPDVLHALGYRGPPLGEQAERALAAEAALEPLTDALRRLGYVDGFSQQELSAARQLEQKGELGSPRGAQLAGFAGDDPRAEADRAAAAVTAEGARLARLRRRHGEMVRRLQVASMQAEAAHGEAAQMRRAAETARRSLQAARADAELAAESRAHAAAEAAAGVAEAAAARAAAAELGGFAALGDQEQALARLACQRADEVQGSAPRDDMRDYGRELQRSWEAAALARAAAVQGEAELLAAESELAWLRDNVGSAPPAYGLAAAAESAEQLRLDTHAARAEFDTARRGAAAGLSAVFRAALRSAKGCAAAGQLLGGWLRAEQQRLAAELAAAEHAVGCLGEWWVARSAAAVWRSHEQTCLGAAEARAAISASELERVADGAAFDAAQRRAAPAPPPHSPRGQGKGDPPPAAAAAGEAAASEAAAAAAADAGRSATTLLSGAVGQLAACLDTKGGGEPGPPATSFAAVLDELTAECEAASAKLLQIVQETDAAAPPPVKYRHPGFPPPQAAAQPQHPAGAGPPSPPARAPSPPPPPVSPPPPMAPAGQSSRGTGARPPGARAGDPTLAAAPTATFAGRVPRGLPQSTAARVSTTSSEEHTHVVQYFC
eukprot:TRINITY_DN15753_c0_g1_i1.p1 TRINITY_DN15753_c0_g1~~TRINITY_DN15753_c0_g1_i1.p1  ORF type:complete len:637 (+),score=171.82 TRINITY_DN15753_c0_g1_i1:70-1911(+)